MLEWLPSALLWTLDCEQEHRECETIKAQALVTLAQSHKLLAEADQVLSRIRKGALIGTREIRKRQR
jgi:hypothetical protein